MLKIGIVILCDCWLTLHLRNLRLRFSSVSPFPYSWGNVVSNFLRENRGKKILEFEQKLTERIWKSLILFFYFYFFFLRRKARAFDVCPWCHYSNYCWTSRKESIVTWMTNEVEIPRTRTRARPLLQIRNPLYITNM